MSENVNTAGATYKNAFDFKNWFNWSGKVSLSEYWKVGPLAILIALLLYASMTGYGSGLNHILVDFLDLVMLVACIPLLALGARRLNDSGVSPLFTLMLLIPFFGGLVYFILMSQKPRIVAASDSKTLYDAEGKPVSTHQVLYDADGNQVVVPVKKKSMSPAMIILIVVVVTPLVLGAMALLLLGALFSSVGHI